MCKNCEMNLSNLELRVLGLEKTVELQQENIKYLLNRLGVVEHNTLGLYQVGHTIAS